MKFILYTLFCLSLFAPLLAQEPVAPKPLSELAQATLNLQTKEKPEERADAASYLGTLGDGKAVPALIEAMLKDEPVVCQACALALLELNDRRAVPALLQALAKQQRDPKIAAGILKALIHFADPAMKEALLAILNDSQMALATRLLALDGLEALNDPSIGPQLLPWITNTDQLELTGRAARLAGKLRVREAIPPLINLLDHPNARCRIIAAQALGMMQDKNTMAFLGRAILKGKYPDQLAAMDALGQLRLPVLFDTFAPMIRSNDAIMRAHAATALGTCGNTAAVPLLVTALGDDNAGVRSAAATALGAYGQPAQEAVLPLLGDGYAEKRTAAAKALGCLGRPEAAPELAKRLADADLTVRDAAITALGRLGAGICDDVLPLVKSDQPGVRAGAAEVLGRITATAAIPELTALQNDADPTVRQWAIFALGEMPQVELDAVVRGLQDNNPAVRIAAARVVGAHRLIRVSRLLLHMLANGTQQERTIAYATLRSFTGYYIGDSYSVWEEWVTQHEKQ